MPDKDLLERARYEPLRTTPLDPVAEALETFPYGVYIVGSRSEAGELNGMLADPATTTQASTKSNQLPQVVKIPTASSAQRKMSAAASAMPMTARYLGALLAASTNMLPVPNRRAPATMKSLPVQFTSPLNCIAKKGNSNMNAVASAIQIKALFCMMALASVGLSSQCHTPADSLHDG